MSELKEFQKKTVESVIQRFKNNQNRVLVADEVGLGKTLIAKGVISEIVRMRKDKSVLTAVYVCSNQNIANQNIQKLNSNSRNYTSDRLSMQSINLFKQKIELEEENTEMQLVALTPDTSFNIKRGRGMKRERELIYAVLFRIIEINKNKDEDLKKLENYMNKLKEVLTRPAKWIDEKEMLNRLKNDLGESESEYINLIYQKLKNEKIIEELINNLSDSEKLEEGKIVKKLRIVFSEISLEMLKPDLVIMDEFQRFKDLIKTKDKYEKNPTDLLVKKFFGMKDLKILLLSATPYKLYATREEINELAMSEQEKESYYNEFLNVMRFLFSCDENEESEEYKKFKTIWDKHSNNLKAIDYENFSVILMTKEEAENQMYKGISRTERISRIKETDCKTINANEYDIKSYIQISEIINKIKETNSNLNFRLDYVKSCPYLLSYMNYELKKKIENYYLENKEELKNLQKEKWFKEQLLWLNGKKIKEYRYDDTNPITKVNSRLDNIKNIIFNENIEKLLWIPPTKNYYNFEGVYKEIKDIDKITKTLIFSAWEMVPRMISTTISYEAERKTIYDAYKKYYSNNKENTKIYMSPRLVFKKVYKDEETSNSSSMNLMTLLYPSQTLSKLFNSINVLNDYEGAINKEDFNEEMKIKIIKELDNQINKKIRYNINKPKDSRWYYLLPLLLDDDEYVEKWLGDIENICKSRIKKNDDEEKNSALEERIKQLKDEYKKVKNNCEEYILGNKPDDFYKVLINLIIGSPANCAYRSLGNSYISTKIAQNFITLFNFRESIAIIDLCYGYKENEYWKNVLKYCFDGNLQAVFDEYVYMLKQSYCLDDNQDEKIFELIEDAMNLKRTNSSLDTFESFKKRINKNSKKNGIKIRTHFATAFSQKETGDEKVINRKESVRNAFNSPFWPFVLSTTSIGQEGLDFHYYCSRIVHWNLPSNPIDLEQREGRINRFKCLAIRKGITKRCQIKNFKKDIWKEIFESINEDEGGLVPNWCLPDDESIDIERIIPIYALSQEENKYERLKEILALYRMTLGQEKQEEILDIIYENNEMADKERLKELFFNLSPYYRKEK